MVDTKVDISRLFLALWPPPEVAQALAQLQARWTWPAGAAVVDPVKLHVTLHFIGAVPSARLDGLREALHVPFAPSAFDPAAGRCHVWPAGIAILELPVPPALRRLHEHLGEALRRAGLPVEERAWRPHVTFARHAQRAVPPPDGAAGVPPWRVAAGYTLVRSAPGRGYEVVHAFR